MSNIIATEELNQKAKEIWTSLAFYGSHERAEPLLNVLEGLPIDLFWTVFNQNWQTCDATLGFGAKFAAMLVERNKEGRFIKHCSPEVVAWYNQLSDPVRVYRGASILALRGPSWTTDRQVAYEFARGHRGLAVYMPMVATGQISKRSVLAAFLHEHELVVRPMLVKNLEMEILFTQDDLFSDPRPEETGDSGL